MRCLSDELGAKLSPLDRWGNTPLDEAVQNSRGDAAAFLKDKGATHSGAFATRNAAAFRTAAAAGDVAALRQRAPHTDVKNAANYEGRTPLHLAASVGSIEAVQFVIGLGAEVSGLDNWGNTPLDAALAQGHADVASYLQSCGALPGSPAGEGFAARNASSFRAAAAAGDVAMMRQLAPHTDVNVANYEGRTPLHLAASVGSLEAVKLLAELGTKVSPCDNWGNTPLDAALAQGHADVASYLQSCGALPGSPAGEGFAARNASSFRAAAAAGDVAMMRQLAPLTDVNGANYEGRTPLHIAASGGSLEAVDLLIELGSAVSPLDSSDNTPLDDALRQGYAKVAVHLEAKGAYSGVSFRKLAQSKTPLRRSTHVLTRAPSSSSDHHPNPTPDPNQVERGVRRAALSRRQRAQLRRLHAARCHRARQRA